MADQGTGRRIGPWRLRILICIVAIVFLLIARDMTQDRGEFYTDVIKDVGVVIMGLVAVDIVWQLVGGDPVQNGLADLRSKLDRSVADAIRLPAFAAHAHRLGFEGVMARQDAFPLRIAQRIDECTRAVDICGWALYLMREDPSVQQALLRAARRGIVIRIIVADSSADWLKATNLPGMLTVVQTVSRDLLPEMRALQEAGGKIRLARDVVLMSSMLRFDDWMQVMPYLLSAASANSPRFHVRGPDTEMFKLWLKEFDHAFEQSTDAFPS